MHTTKLVCSIRVGRSIQGFGLSPGITKEQRVGVESLFKGACQKFSGEGLSQVCSLNLRQSFSATIIH